MGERTRVLIVDDDESIRKTLAAILEEEGYRVDTAPNGRRAIRKSKSQFYNLALIDIRLPDKIIQVLFIFKVYICGL